MRILLIAAAVLAVAYLYGWRFHPEAIGSKTKRPVFTQSAKDNKVAGWHPGEFLDGFNGNRDFKSRQERAGQKV
jgi:hypothetical protein